MYSVFLEAWKLMANFKYRKLLTKAKLIGLNISQIGDLTLLITSRHQLSKKSQTIPFRQLQEIKVITNAL